MRSSESEDIPGNYCKTVYITVSSIAGYTRKGEFEITVKKSVDYSDEWEDAVILKFDSLKDYSSNCNSSFTFFAFGLLLSALNFKRKVF